MILLLSLRKSKLINEMVISNRKGNIILCSKYRIEKPIIDDDKCTDFLPNRYRKKVYSPISSIYLFFILSALNNPDPTMVTSAPLS